jgi:UDP-N-acetylmuramoyl-tripeptide--D-alanyl-D-alanine ligase
MRAISFEELIAATGGTPVGIDDLSRTFSRVEIDSRKVAGGDLFWALEGKRHDAHKFVKQALTAGAMAVVVDAAKSRKMTCPRIEVENTLAALWQLAHWYRKQFDALVIAVTGSVGKTTTRRMITSVLSVRFAGVESPHNFNNHFGVPLSLLQLERHHEFAVIELGASHTGEIEGLALMSQPEVGVITAIGPAHLDEFGSLDAIIQTKGELLQVLPESGFAVLNGDDRAVRGMAERSSCSVIFVGERDDNDIQATKIDYGNADLSFQVGASRYQLAVAGKHHLPAALIAVAIGMQFDMTPEEIALGLKKYEPAPGRCDTLEIGGWTVIDDTYNANPLSMSAACQALQSWQTHGKRILVTGDMLSLGEWSRDFHRLFGEEVARAGIDYLVAVGSQAAAVAGSARKLGMDAGCLAVCRDHDTALMLLDCWLTRGDVVLVKGSRGMRMEAIITGLRKLAEQQAEQSQDSRAA